MIKGMTDKETLAGRPHSAPAIKVYKGDNQTQNNQGRSVVGKNLGLKYRLEIESIRLRQDVENIFPSKYVELIPIYLAYEKPEQTFPTFMESWIASGCETRCDGEELLKLRNL